MEPEAVEAAVRRLLAEVTTMTLATVQAGVPWATTVYFAPDGFNLVFLSSPGSRHCRNLAANAACAAALSPEVSSWRDILGLQMEGRAELVAGLAAKARAMAAYFAKFPFVKDLLTAPGETASRMGRVSAHVFRPTTIRYIDNGPGFGTHFILRLDAGRLIGLPQREDGD
ncbi:pyridoxamine 5'-phosphate oxidase family protein [Desulfovibrio sp. TomC]|uniref:pyridoxamine 5'-phosphate oxidase family protein n=1 Tax=Desulfovibrio sp. TomC TaxID=1562888 RepID=UPI0005BB7EAC|nr:pyridoxamine 5'-phosphate oxidase family protein [Desulfovibrio sp. TomC]